MKPASVQDGYEIQVTRKSRVLCCTLTSGAPWKVALTATEAENMMRFNIWPAWLTDDYIRQVRQLDQDLDALNQRMITAAKESFMALKPKDIQVGQAYRNRYGWIRYVFHINADGLAKYLEVLDSTSEPIIWACQTRQIARWAERKVTPEELAELQQRLLALDPNE